MSAAEEIRNQGSQNPQEQAEHEARVQEAAGKLADLKAKGPKGFTEDALTQHATAREQLQKELQDAKDIRTQGLSSLQDIDGAGALRRYRGPRGQTYFCS